MKRLIAVATIVGVMLLSGCGLSSDVNEELLNEAGNIEDTLNLLQEEANNL